MRSLACLVLAACAAASPPPPKPPTPPPDAVDLVTAVSAGGVDHPQGLDWPAETGAKPGAEVFKNASLLGTLPASRLMLAMQSMRGSLGADCDHCHVEHDFKSDDKQPKQTARSMMKMALDIDTRFFGGKSYVTCYTCHRGETQPDEFKPAKPPMEWPLPALAAADAQKPAREVYKNLQTLGDMPAGRLSEVMVAFSSALGTGCIHCHEQGQWAADDKPAKRRAREMMAMLKDVSASYFPGGKFPVKCGTCHRGQVRPARSAGPLLKVAATLPGGGTAPSAFFALGPAGFAPKTRAEFHAALEKDESNHILLGRVVQSAEAEVGHVAPGTYSLCTASAPADHNDPKGAERPIACAPVTVAPEPDVQTVTRVLPPL
jgi:hypothetical protein